MPSPVELRSDTFTTPTPEMRAAMADAVVGDDVWGEDPTVNALQEHCAELLGKEAGLFVPSGSMGNEVCIAAQTEPGDEVIVDQGAHVLDAELGAPATVSHVMVRPVPSNRGVFDSDVLASAIRPPARFSSHTTLLCLENTSQSAAGAVLPIDAVRAMAQVARDHDVRVHIDGARLFNAVVASGVSAREFAAEADTVSFCFSKGLGAPIGSMVVGPQDVIDKARRIRKRLGGGMRQVGVIAAAARVAVDTMVDRLADDHANARRLAEGIANVWPEAVDFSLVETNIVFIRTGERSAPDIAQRLLAHDVRVHALGPRLIRCLTHKDVDVAGIDRAISAFHSVLSG